MEKLCPFCSETIKATAIKCKHCGEFLDGRSSFEAEKKSSTSSLGIFQLIAVIIAVPMFWLMIVAGVTIIIVVPLELMNITNEFFVQFSSLVGAIVGIYVTYKVFSRMPENIKSNIKVINFKQVISLIVVVVLIFGIVILSNRPAPVTYIQQSQPEQSQDNSSGFNWNFLFNWGNAILDSGKPKEPKYTCKYNSSTNKTECY